MNSKISYKLRKFKKTDVNSIVKYANNKNIAKFLTNEFPYPYSKKDAELFINFISNENPTNTFVIEVNKEAAGAITVTPQAKIIATSKKETPSLAINICDKQGELGYWLAEKYWNNGIMTSAIKEMVNYGFETFDINCIYATPFVPNIASQRVLKKAGFNSNLEKKSIIKNNEIYEVLIYSISK
ncbi:MAG: GNAT family N-acetyltransferase [Methanobrevibacter sp.]|nr:GNAT family N-acetyltransferase [Methanobrevibacter sp.]